MAKEKTQEERKKLNRRDLTEKDKGELKRIAPIIFQIVVLVSD